MDVVTQAELMAMGVIALVVFAKTYIMYWAKRRKDHREFDPTYAVTAIFGFFMAYSLYQVQTTDIFQIIRTAAPYAIGFNGLADIMAKLGKEII